MNPQGKFEFGVQIGSNNFLGDLGGHLGKGSDFAKDYMLKTVKPFGGISLNYYPYAWLNIIAGINLTQVAGADSLIDNKNGFEKWRYYRNLSFKSSIFEGYIGAEVYPLMAFQNYEISRFRLQPYFGLGVGLFHFNPKANYNGQWVDLKPLRLEGQGMAEYPNRKEYSLIQMEMVMGAGVKYYIKENMYFGFEILHRKTFTDYVDDVSTDYINPALFANYLTPAQATMARQLAYRETLINPSMNRPYIDKQRGDPKENDAFFSGLLRFGMRLNGDNATSRQKKQLKCPVFY